MFITPNMTSDGHDTDVTTAGAWTRAFLDPLLTNKNFMNNTLVLVTWDENHTYTQKNRVLGLLLGDAVPSTLVGTVDNAIYTHYSEIATVEANWNLHTLGRYDVGANVFAFVAQQTGDTLRNWTGTPSFNSLYFNQSYPGPLNNSAIAWPEPNTDAVVNGRTVLPAVVSAWSKTSANTVYGTGIEIADGQHQAVAVAKSSGGVTPGTASSTAATPTKSSAARKRSERGSIFGALLGIAFAVVG